MTENLDPALAKFRTITIEDKTGREIMAQVVPAQPPSEPKNDALAKLIADLQNTNEAVRLQAAKKLGTMSAAARPALTALRRRLADPDEDVRLVAAAAIRRIEGAWGHEWIKMTLPDHRFEIHFPAQPERRDGQGMEETWKLEVRKQGWELDRGEPVQLLGFIVCSVLPPNRVSAQPARFWFDGIQQQILKGGSLVGATAVLTSRDFSFADKFPARDVEFKTKDVGRFRVRLVHTSSAVYMIFAVGTVDFLDGDLVKRFTESFKTWDEPAQEPPTGAERVKDLIQRLQRPEPFDRLFALRALAKLGAEAKNAIPQVEKLANQGTEEERRYTPGTC